MTVSLPEMDWILYYLDTESFDRRVDGRWSERGHNTWQPVPGWAHNQASRHAARRFRRVPLASRANLAAKTFALEFTEAHFKREANVVDVLHTFCASFDGVTRHATVLELVGAA